MLTKWMKRSLVYGWTIGVIGLIVTGCTQQQAPPPSTFVENLTFDLGSKAEHPYLGGGWYSDETSGDGKTFVWSQGNTSRFFLPLKPDKSYVLQLQVIPFVYPNASSQTVKFYLNETYLESVALQNKQDWQNIAVHLPKNDLDNKGNILELVYSRVTAPKEVTPTNSDTRKIAVCCHSLSVSPEK